MKLTKQELTYWEKWQKKRDKQAGDYLVELYLPLVEYVVQRFMISLPKTINKDDIRSYAFEGLLDALNKFNIDKDLKFETYASWRIKGAIIDGLRKNDWLPRSIRDKVKKIEDAYTNLEQKSNHSITDEEVSDYLGISVQELNKTVSEAALAAMVSIDETTDDGNNKLRKYDIIPNENAESPERNLSEKLIKEALINAIERLPEKEKLVISLCYFEELRLTDIAEVLNISISRVSQLHSKAVLRLRASILSIYEYY